MPNRPKSKLPDKSKTPAKPTSRQSDQRRATENARHAARTPAEKLERNWRQFARPNTPRPDTVNSRDSRKVALANAYCDWSDLEAVFRMYQAAATLSELEGEQYVVDHLVPLINPLVCGLHTHTNLQVIKATENQLKGNYFWPDMWPITWGTFVFLLDSP